MNLDSYYLNTRPQSNGDHELHQERCPFLPSSENRIYLGQLAHCSYAVEKARSHFSQVNGCAHCSRICHTS